MVAKADLERARVESGEIQEVLSDDDGEADQATTSAAKLTETMQGLANSLVNLKQEAEAAFVAEEEQVAKRPRKAAPKRDEHMEPFGKAG